MRLAILGGGGFRVPLVYEAVATRAAGDVPITEVVLFDDDQGRLDAIKAVIDGLILTLPDPGSAPTLLTTTSLPDAIRGADYIFAAIRVGGAAARTKDERVALDLGLLGQETIGPGGLAYALRTVPVMVAIAKVIAELAPSAWTINFTNPAGVVTQAMQTVLGDRVIGICDTPIGLVNRVARLLDVPPDAIDYDYVGLNHLGWLRAARVEGVDRLPELLADRQRLDRLEEAELIGSEWIAAIGALPNEYLYYYWHTDKVVRRLREGGETRGEFLVRQQSGFYEQATCCADPLTLWQTVLGEREATYMAEARTSERDEADIAGGGYQGVALRLMSVLSGGGDERMILNVRNGDLIPQLPPDTVVEVGCRVDRAGPRPIPIGPVALDQVGMMARLRASEWEIARASLTGDADLAWQGFATHPLVDSPELGAKLLAGYRKAHQQIESLFT